MLHVYSHYNYAKYAVFHNLVYHFGIYIFVSVKTDEGTIYRQYKIWKLFRDLVFLCEMRRVSIFLFSIDCYQIILGHIHKNKIDHSYYELFYIIL